MTAIYHPMRFLSRLGILLFGLAIGQISYALTFQIYADPTSTVDAKQEWDWAIRSSGLEFSLMSDSSSNALASETSLAVLESECLSQDQFAQLESWIHAGGTLIIAGLNCWSDGSELRLEQGRAELSGLTLEATDPGLAGVYPRVTDNSPLLAPFSVDDGIRLGEQGIARSHRLQPDSASVLARGYRIEPGPGDWARPSDAITMASRSIGDGRVVFLNFSPAQVTACHPDAKGNETDCSGAGTARGLMRLLIANLLWEVRGEQIPIAWETPGDRPLGVVITGDVHVSDEAYQVRSARLMAERIASREAPITYFVVGEVAEESPLHLESLKRQDSVFLGSHSAFGDTYDPDTLSGASRISADIRSAESMLGIESYDKDRRWRAGFRSHGWASDESVGQAWTAMNEAGISVVFDHNADPVLPEISVSAPVEWFEGDVRRRLFLPLLERSVHTQSGDFVLPHDLAGKIFSIGSPEPDPCCNWAVTFDTYMQYIRGWHENLLRIGQLGGATEVWLWHPSTPVWKGGLTALREFVGDLVSNPRVDMFLAHEFATWAFNRDQVTVSTRWNASGHVHDLTAIYDQASLAPLPPGSRPAAGELSYWVLGDADIDGWRAERTTDPMGRTLTILSKTLVKTDRRP